MSELVHTEFKTETEVLDNGVEVEVIATEEFTRGGEQIERTTKLAILDDGSVSIRQRHRNQDIGASLTLGSDVVGRLVKEAQNR